MRYDLLQERERAAAVCIARLTYHKKIAPCRVYQLVYESLRYKIALARRSLTATIEHKVSVLVIQERRIHIVEHFL